MLWKLKSETIVFKKAFGKPKCLNKHYYTKSGMSKIGGSMDTE